MLSGTIAVPDSTVANPTAAAYYLFPDSGMAVRFRITLLTSGAPVADGRTTDFFQSSLVNLSQQKLLEIIAWELINLRLITADGLGQSANYASPIHGANANLPVSDTFVTN